MIITIDGPAGSGKTTLARALAQRFGLHHLQTGLLYRAAAYAAYGGFYNQQEGVSFDCEAFMRACTLSNVATIEYTVDDSDQVSLLWKGVNITPHLNNQKLDLPAACISANGEVRALLLSIQQVVAHKYSIVADGRDCGSVVFPAADYKFFLTADVSVRALRVKHDPQRGSATKGIELIEKELQNRDKRDQERVVAPLIVPDNAIIIDSSGLAPTEVLAKVISVIDG